MGFAREAADQVLFMDEEVILEQSPFDVFFTNPVNERVRSFVGKIMNK